MEPKASWASAPVGGLSVLTNGPQLVETMTKRELFAAMAMQGLLANRGAWEDLPMNGFAGLAVDHADFLLAELSKGGA